MKLRLFMLCLCLGPVTTGETNTNTCARLLLWRKYTTRIPKHPGGLHYLIHSYDDPVHAPLGMRAARSYARVAPEAAHALHMPSHIFVAMGMWEEVVSSNEASSSAADARRYRKKLGVDSRGFHSLHWLEYGYLQQGRFVKAQQLLEDMKRDFAKSGSRRAAFHLAVMRAGYLIETGNYIPEVLDIEIPASKLSKKSLAADRFARAYAYLKTGKTAKVDTLIGQLEAMAPMHAHHMDLPKSSATLCCSPNYSTTDDEDAGTLHAIHVMTLEMKALRAHENGEAEEALKLILQAADMEEQMDFMFGPPIIAKPSHELLGEFYLKLEQPQKAVKAFEKALLRAPGRTLSLKGLTQAYKLLEETELANRFTSQLQQNLLNADKAQLDIPETQGSEKK